MLLLLTFHYFRPSRFILPANESLLCQEWVSISIPGLGLAWHCKSYILHHLLFFSMNTPLILPDEKKDDESDMSLRALA